MDVYFPRLARLAADPSAAASDPVVFRLRGLEADSGATVSASTSIASAILLKRTQDFRDSENQQGGAAWGLWPVAGTSLGNVPQFRAALVGASDVDDPPHQPKGN